MDLMEVRRGLLASMGGKIPSFMNHLESGSFSVESGNSYVYIDMPTIARPKGIAVFSHDFDLTSAKENKPLLGAFAAYWIEGDPELPVIQSGNDNHIELSKTSTYGVNWGSVGDVAMAAYRQTRTESRGLSYYMLSTRRAQIRGFGSGDYDFKFGVTYYWIAWD